MPSTGAPTNTWYPDDTAPVAPLENLFLQLATSVNVWGAAMRKIWYITDLDGLVALTGLNEGDLCHCDEGEFFLQYADGAWVQVTTARFASTGARDTAFAKASNAYKVLGARALVSGVTYEWYTTGAGVAVAGWFPVLGLVPTFKVTGVGGSVQSIGSGTWVNPNSAMWGTPEINQGMTSWSAGVLTVAQAGAYELAAGMGFSTFGAVARGGAQLTKNTASVDTNSVVKITGNTRNDAETPNVIVKLAAGDALRFNCFQDSGGAINSQQVIQTFIQARYVQPA